MKLTGTAVIVVLVIELETAVVVDHVVVPVILLMGNVETVVAAEVIVPTVVVVIM